MSTASLRQEQDKSRGLFTKSYFSLPLRRRLWDLQGGLDMSFDDALQREKRRKGKVPDVSALRQKKKEN